MFEGNLVDGIMLASTLVYNDIYLLKIDSEGALLWETTHGGRFGDMGMDVQGTSDGGYVVVGDTQSKGAGENDVYLVKVDSLGGLVWDMTVGGPVHDQGRSIQLIDDGGYIVVGRTWNMGQAGDVYLVKLTYVEHDVPEETEETDEPEEKGGSPGSPWSPWRWA